MRLRFIKFSVTLIVVFAIDCLLAGRLAINTEKNTPTTFTLVASQSTLFSSYKRRADWTRHRCCCYNDNHPCQSRTKLNHRKSTHCPGGSVAEWLACWTQAQKGLQPRCCRVTVLGKLLQFTPIVPLFTKQRSW